MSTVAEDINETARTLFASYHNAPVVASVFTPPINTRWWVRLPMRGDLVLATVVGSTQHTILLRFAHQPSTIENSRYAKSDVLIVENYPPDSGK